ncbi:MAG TPA: RluA family pseudouridine synthase [Candidatus Saccharimonadales bacterium]
MRLDAYLAEFWPEHSRATWQKYCQKGYVRVNGVVVTDIAMKLDEDDTVTPDLPAAQDFSDQKLPILYEDENVMVINKPVGTLTHAKGAIIDEFTAAEFIRPHTSFGNEGNRPGVVHRLDRDTSGVLILAKNPDAASYLGRQFSDRKAKKTYIAVIDGHLAHPAASVDLPIERNPKAPATFRVGANGKSAQTNYQVLATNKNQSLVELRPVTGRTHQLRVHMAYLGAPIAGDRIYGKANKRLLLHAHQLEITLPGGVRKTFSAPIPPEFTDGFDYEF